MTTITLTERVRFNDAFLTDNSAHNLWRDFYRDEEGNMVALGYQRWDDKIRNNSMKYPIRISHKQLFLDDNGGYLRDDIKVVECNGREEDAVIETIKTV